MTSKKRNVSGALIIVFCLILGINPHLLQAEKISFQLNYWVPSFPSNDLDLWLTSTNQLWQDWATAKNGQTSGEFPPLQYSPSLELGLRVSIVEGLSLVISGSHFSSQSEGQVEFLRSEAAQMESYLLRNRVSFLPLKIGFNYRHPLPFYQPLAGYITFGRHLVFISYKKVEEYEAKFDVLGQEFIYWFNKDGSYRSESLGYFAELGIEYSPLRYISIFAGVEQIWNTTDGFKGSYTYADYTGEEKRVKASLYFYESNQWNLGQYYHLLNGDKKRPAGDSVRNVRQATFNYGGFSFKLGVRFNF